MIGKSDWFVRRKYSGWGLTPVKWQGFLYIAGIVAVGFVLQTLPLESPWKIIVLGVFTVIFILDVLLIMASQKLDEREAKIEALAERNASWGMITALSVLLIYSAINQKNDLMPYFIIVLIVGLLAKAGTNLIFRKRAL